MILLSLGVLLLTFLLMEWSAWALHKYVMHGFLWSLHEDHHTPVPGQNFQKNDYFAFFFAVPSFLLILSGSLSTELINTVILSSIGYGIMIYGVAYFLVHEVIIHRRFVKVKVPKNFYIRGLVEAHRDHHKVRTKSGASNFGMLAVPLRYWLSQKKTHV